MSDVSFLILSMGLSALITIFTLRRRIFRYQHGVNKLTGFLGSLYYCSLSERQHQGFFWATHSVICISPTNEINIFNLKVFQ